MGKLIDITGQQFNKLTVIGKADRNEHGNRTYWICQCNCEKKTIVEVESYQLRNGHTQSCGCLQAERTSISNSKHKLTNTRFYNIWNNIKRRGTGKSTEDCYNNNEIKICDRWMNFENFHVDMYKEYLNFCETHGEKNTTIDRKDSNKDYEPSNCRWATNTVQAINQNIRCTNTSGYKGVEYRNDTGHWRATITINYRRIQLGTFNTKEEAVAARKMAEEIYHKPLLENISDLSLQL